MDDCPDCGSLAITVKKYRGVDVVLCSACHYDGRDEIDIEPEYNTSQKAKGEFTPYKSGGPKRSR